MPRMIRKQIYIELRQEELLKRRAKQLGIPESELIRRGIDQISRVPLNLTPDLQAWEEAKAFIKQRMNIVAPQTGRDWTRDDLYDERFKRYSG